MVIEKINEEIKSSKNQMKRKPQVTRTLLTDHFDVENGDHSFVLCLVICFRGIVHTATLLYQ